MYSSRHDRITWTTPRNLTQLAMSRDHGDGNEAFSTLDWLARLQKQGNLLEALSTDLKSLSKTLDSPGL